MSSPSNSLLSDPDSTVQSLAIPESSQANHRRPVGLVVWAIVTVGFLVYIAFGSIQARMWTLNRIEQAWNQEIAPRRIWHVWTYQLQYLPEMGSEAFMKGLFGGALVIIVVGCIYAVWLMLDEVRNDKAALSDSTPSGVEQA